MTINIRASGLARVMACQGSVALAAQCPEPESSEAEQEGTAAHEAAELVLTGQAPDLDALVDRQMSNGVFVTAEMIDHLRNYVEMLEGSQIECHGEWSPCDGVKITGTTDAVRYDQDAKTLYVTDLKYGWRIVEAKDNWQLIAYAILQGGLSHGVERISMAIYQPQPWHPDGSLRMWVITQQELQQYALRITTWLAALSNDLETGTHCTYCAALATCPAARQMQYNAIDVALNADTPDTLSGDGLAMQLDALAIAADRIKLRQDALQDAALAAIQKGEHVAGWTAKQSFGNKTWKDGVTPDAVAALTGRQDLSPPALITPTQALKRGVDTSLIDVLAHRPSRGIKLARASKDDAARAFTQAQPEKEA